MKVLFMGTPEFAVPTLEAIVAAGHSVVGVYTQPDKAVGRKQILTPPPVKVCAEKYGFPVFQPVTLRDGSAEENIRALSPDIIVVVAYGKILPEALLKLPKYGCVNIHASLLPKYRGAAPINWVILNGEKESGVTSMQMAEGLDTGDMLIKKSTEIGENETYQELYSRLSEMGADVLLETLSAIENGTLTPEKQDDSLTCYSPMITKEMSALDFNKSAAEVHNTIRGVTGFAMLDGKRLKIFSSMLTGKTSEDAANGEIVDTASFDVKCGDGQIIRFLEVQPEGKKRMKVSDFLRGNKLSTGKIFNQEV